MDEPKYLVWMGNDMRGRAHTNKPICARKIDPAIGHHLVEQKLGRVVMRQIYAFDLVPQSLKGGFEPIDDVSTTSVQERHKR
jgi:hypothetical protein